MEAISVRLARLSEGENRAILYLFALLLFLVSSFLNNVTAVLVVLPIVFLLLRSLNLNQAFVASFFSLMLAISNVGGAATPIGDFPAIIIMKSGLTNFSNYFNQAKWYYDFQGPTIFCVKQLVKRQKKKL
jgi:Na+/H+ antiporter NhaD/arsenite permease-like protein